MQDRAGANISPPPFFDVNEVLRWNDFSPAQFQQA
jgi:hypothetical protein